MCTDAYLFNVPINMTPLANSRLNSLVLTWSMARRPYPWLSSSCKLVIHEFSLRLNLVSGRAWWFDFLQSNVSRIWWPCRSHYAFLVLI